MPNPFKLPSVLKLPNFRNLYFAGATSELGSFVTETVLMLFVFKLSNQDKSYLGILRATFLVCLTLGGILGGPLGNSLNRKKILIFCDIARIPLLISLFFIVPRTNRSAISLGYLIEAISLNFILETYLNCRLFVIIAPNGLVYATLPAFAGNERHTH